MKYKGKKLEGINTDVLVLPRSGQGNNIVIKAQAVKDYKDFDKLVSMPEPPIRTHKGGVKERLVNDPEFLVKLQEYAHLKNQWSVLISLADSDIEWETVDMTKPSTWKNWEAELRSAGFIEAEIIRIMNLYASVNCLDDGILAQAKEDFLAEALQQPK